LKYPKGLFWTLLAVVVLILLVPLFFSGGLRVERGVFIEAPVDRVYDLVADLERHPEWHPWDITDSMPRLVFGEKRYGAEASYFWIGNRDNHGMLKWITATRSSESGRRIEGVLDLSSLGESEISFRFTPGTGGVEVREEFRKVSGHNLMMRYLRPLYRVRVAEQLEGNLSRLKRAAEVPEADAALEDTSAAAASMSRTEPMP
jgi:uncharacterized membrane protein